MQYKLWIHVISIFYSLSVLAENITTIEPSSKLTHSFYTFTVKQDGSYTNDIDYAITLLKEDAIESTKQQNISYSTSVESVDVIEAYTKKTNGKRIDVPKTNFQLEVNSGKDKASPAFSDRTTLTIIFPDLEVGDTIILRYKKKPIRTIISQPFF